MSKRTFPESVFEEIRKSCPNFQLNMSGEDLINNMKGNVSERNIDIFVKYYNGRTLDSLAEEYGVTRERIRQIAKKSIRYIKCLGHNDIGINDMKLSTRAYRALVRYMACEEGHKFTFNYSYPESCPVLSVDKVLELYNSGKLLKIRNLGIKSILEIADQLMNLGYEIDGTLYLQ